MRLQGKYLGTGFRVIDAIKLACEFTNVIYRLDEVLPIRAMLNELNDLSAGTVSIPFGEMTVEFLVLQERPEEGWPEVVMYNGFERKKTGRGRRSEE